MRADSGNPEKFQQFVMLVMNAAKKTIPRGFRKSYIPEWTAETERLYREYQKSGNSDVATKLLDSLDQLRQSKMGQADGVL